jgi:hypothetical protein
MKAVSDGPKPVIEVHMGPESDAAASTTPVQSVSADRQSDFSGNELAAAGQRGGRHLAEIHAAPRWLWRALVLTACGSSIALRSWWARS